MQKINTKITILKKGFEVDTAGYPDFIRDCQTSHIVAVKQKRGYKIVKHLWNRIPMNFKSKKDLLAHLSEYM